MSHINDNVVSTNSGNFRVSAVGDNIMNQLEKQVKINASLQKQIDILKNLVVALAGEERLLVQAEEWYYLSPYMTNAGGERLGPFATSQGADEVRALLGIEAYYYISVTENVKI